MKKINKTYYNKIYNVITSYKPKGDKDKEICPTFSGKLVDSDNKYFYFTNGDYPIIVLKEAVVTMMCLKSKEVSQENEHIPKFIVGDWVEILSMSIRGHIQRVCYFDKEYHYTVATTNGKIITLVPEHDLINIKRV